MEVSSFLIIPWTLVTRGWKVSSADITLRSPKALFDNRQWKCNSNANIEYKQVLGTKLRNYILQRLLHYKMILIPMILKLANVRKVMDLGFKILKA